MVFGKQGFLSEKHFLLESSIEFLSENCQKAAGQKACRSNLQASVCMDQVLKNTGYCNFHDATQEYLLLNYLCLLKGNFHYPNTVVCNKLLKVLVSKA